MIVAVPVSIAESAPQRDEQISHQFWTRHIRESFREHGFQEREKISLPVAINTRAGVRGGEARVSDVA
jgi:hypothetical protein